MFLFLFVLSPLFFSGESRFIPSKAAAAEPPLLPASPVLELIMSDQTGMPLAERALDALIEEIEPSKKETDRASQTPLEELDEIEEESRDSGFLFDLEINHPTPSPEVTYDIPIVENKSVERYIVLFQTRLRDHFEKWLIRSGRYVPMMREILHTHGLPQDLVYLALIESGFNPRAFSRSRASGPWQFIKGTGRRYGLRINRWMDERRDPVKSTNAAARYLKDLYEMFGSWPLAMASYNGGEGRVKRALKRTKAKDFWELRTSWRLRRETRNYVPKFMAAILIAKNPEKYGFHVDYDEPLHYEAVEIRQPTYLSSIAKASGISVKEIKEFNPELKRMITPPHLSNYRLKLPPGKKEVFLANFKPEAEKKVVIGRRFKHRVRKGETATSIARKYGVRVRELLSANSLTRRSIIRAGQYITISDGMGDTDLHYVRRGETLSTIARRYRVSLRGLLEVNQLRKKSIIRPGQTLIVPDANNYRASGHRHRIRRGETVSSIARKYAVGIRQLLKTNRLRKNSIIRAGRYLIIP
ncbi:MAG: LysM peptidoglycan-binding domain-containing protein [Nitrospiria bacterium]